MPQLPKLRNSWGPNIVVLEPAPRLTYPARYVAPTLTPESSHGLDLILTLFGVFFVGAMAGAAVSGIAGVFLGRLATDLVVLVFYLLLIAVVVTAYVLVARHGLRVGSSGSEQLWAEVTAGNVAWRSLPPAARERYREQLRAMNAAAHLLLVDPEQADPEQADPEQLGAAASGTVREHSALLQATALSLLEQPAPSPAPRIENG